MSVDFQFELDEVVLVSVTKKTGIITMCALDDGGKKYFVQGDGDGAWWKENLLSRQ